MQHEGKTKKQTWHNKHEETFTRSQRIADGVANYMGSWAFIIILTTLVVLWMSLNVIGIIWQWDPYPFILLNLLFSTQAAYAAPIIMMAHNRQNERDRHQALEDYETNLAAKAEIEALQIDLARIENDKLDKIIALLEDIKKNRK